MKKKLLYIGHSYHDKTKSTEFLIEYLNEYYDVTVLLDNAWVDGKNLAIGDCSGYDAIVFFQILISEKVFNKIKCKNKIFFPMYDAYPTDIRPHLIYLIFEYKRLKIVNFSKTLNDILYKYGANTMYIKYFIEPQEFYKGNIDEVFFWQRITDININTVKPLFDSSNIKIHIHKVVDPPHHKFVQPSESDEKIYNITYSDWFDTREQMLECIKQKAIYIAPRKSEGIGMSFLEAMSIGKCVIANNEPTMNEYIEHNVNGYLFDINNPTAIDLSNIDEIQKNAYQYTKNGYQKWLIERKSIIDYIEKPYKNNIKFNLNKFPYIINKYINIILQFFLKIEISKTKGNYIRIFHIYIRWQNKDNKK